MGGLGPANWTHRTALIFVSVALTLSHQTQAVCSEITETALEKHTTQHLVCERSPVPNCNKSTMCEQLARSSSAAEPDRESNP